MALKLDLQIATMETNIPSLHQFKLWVKTALPKNKENSEITIRVVDIPEITELNKIYRKKDQPTNILSFPADIPPEINSQFLGDIIICAAIVNKEAQEQHKSIDEHWAHLTVHGILHLLGFDHKTAKQAKLMEQTEITVLKMFGYKNPYTPLA